MDTKNKRFDVVVVGDGPTALSCIYHLSKYRGLHLAQIIPERKDFNSEWPTDNPHGYAHEGNTDNLNRLVTAYGKESAREIWSYGDRSFASICRFLEINRIPFFKGDRVRISTVDHEDAEFSLARKWFDEIFQKKNVEFNDCEGGEGQPFRIQKCSDAVTFDCKQFLEAMRTGQNVQAFRVGEVKFQSEQQAFFLDNNVQVGYEIAIFCCHLETSRHIKSLHSVLISYAEQCEVFEINQIPSWLCSGSFMSHRYGHHWGYLYEDRIYLGGSRYLRKEAGIGAVVPEFLPSITENTRSQFEGVLGKGALGKSFAQFATLECRPCDEIPLIGPLFGDGRILIATGFSGQTLAMGFHAGQCLTQLIVDGNSFDLPRIFWPERLRSLSEG